jgi:hypothetical protein
VVVAGDLDRVGVVQGELLALERLLQLTDVDAVLALAVLLLMVGISFRE